MNKNNYELTKQEMAEMLNVKLRGFEKIEETNTLNERLLRIGFRFISKRKEGRKNVYVIELLEDTSYMTFDEVCKHYKVKKPDKFKKHSKNRINYLEGCVNLITKTSFANDIEESIYQVDKFDNVLMEERLMDKDGWVYLAYQDGKCRFVEESEYRHFWKNNASIKRLLNSLGVALENKEITLHEYNLDYNKIIDNLSRQGEIYHKIPAYKKSKYYDIVKNKFE